VPLELYMTGGQRWMYTCVFYMAVTVVKSPLESLLALEHVIRAYSEACLIFCWDAYVISSLRACLKSA